MKSYLRFSSCLALLSLALLLILPTTVSAAPVFGETWQLSQPDGSLVDVRIWGDEFYQVVESPDGFTLVRDPATMVICYARLSGDGNALESTGVRLGSRDPASLGLAPHVRISAAATEAAVALARSRPLNLPSMNKGAYFPAITGNVEGLCLLVDFDDQVATIAQSDVEDFCNMVGYTGFSNNGSVRDYFGDVSEGNLDYTNYVMPTYFRAPNDFSWYDDPGETWLARGKQLMFEILDQLEADGLDFSQYDSNGDGYIDAINLFYAGSTTAGWTEGMWPGSGWIQDQWSADGVSTLKFQFTGMGTDLSIATYCHENGHMLGFWPDLYDYYDDADPESEKSAGIGKFGLMCNAASGTNPVEPCAYHKYIAGWGNVTTYATQQFDIPTPTSSSNRIYKFDKPGSTNEYWLVENRQQTARDTHIPDSGLAIWHIDTNGNNSDNEMTPASHYLVTLVQADGLWDLENNVNQGDSDDLWGAPGYEALRPYTSPDTDWWDGTASDFTFFDISASGPAMTFSFSPSNEPPVAVCQDVEVSADGDCHGIVTAAMVDGGSSDPDGDPITLEMNPPGPFELGSTAVTLTVRDDKGEFDYCTAVITVVDTTPPVVTCPSDIEIECTEPGGVSASDSQLTDFFAAFMAEDNCDDSLDITNDAPAFFGGPCDGGGGVTMVTYTATDDAGNSSACAATVTVVDTTPPEIEVTVSPQVLWPSNHKMVDVEYTVTVSDICDDSPMWEMVSLSSNEPDNDLGDGTTEPDIMGADFGTADTSVELRAERQGVGTSRIYQATFQVTDCSGNTALAFANVYVPHDKDAIDALLSSSGAATPTSTEVSFMVSGASLWKKEIPAEFIIGDGESGSRAVVEPRSAVITNTAGVVPTTAFYVRDVDNDDHPDVLVAFDRRSLMTLAEESTEIDGDPVMVLEIGIKKFLVIDMSVIHEIDLDIDRIIGTLRDGGDEIDLPADRDRDVVVAARATGIVATAPNPFNPMTTVSYYLSKAGHVDLAVFDISGRMVNRLINESVGSGEHSVVWTGVDTRGGRVASGVYFFRMRSGDVVDIKRVVMIK